MNLCSDNSVIDMNNKDKNELNVIKIVRKLK